MKKLLLSAFCMAGSFMLIISCQKSEDETKVTPKSSEKRIIGDPAIIGLSDVTVEYDNGIFTYILTVPGSPTITALKLYLNVSPKATISPNPSIERDYSQPVKFTITAEDGSKQDYTIIILTQAVGKSCLPTKIEEIDTKEYVEFQYDSQKRITRVDCYFRHINVISPYDPEKHHATLYLTYNATGDLVSAKATGIYYTQGDDFIYKPIYQNGKFVRLAYRNEYNGADGEINLTVDVQGQIARIGSDDINCNQYIYDKGAKMQLSSCIGSTIFTSYSYPTNKFGIFHFIKSQMKYPALIMTLNDFLEQFDWTGVMSSWNNYSPMTEVHYFHPGGVAMKRNSMTYKVNSENYPTEIKTIYQTYLNTNFPRSSTYTYKVTYTDCQ